MSQILDVPKGSKMLIKCIISKNKHDSGYNCFSCEGEVGGKKFKSIPCVDAISSDVGINIDFPDEKTLQIWLDSTRESLTIDGFGATIIVHRMLDERRHL